MPVWNPNIQADTPYRQEGLRSMPVWNPNIQADTPYRQEAYYSNRCVARLALRKFDLALVDADVCLDMSAQTSVKAWYHKGQVDPYYTLNRALMQP